MALRTRAINYCSDVKQSKINLKESFDVSMVTYDLLAAEVIE